MFEDILKTLVTAMLPILEIRGAIPVGVAAGMDPWTAFAIGFVGNMLPVPFLILLARKVIEWMKKHHILDKPLPGTGAWTGALVASLLDMRLKRALPAIGMGVAVAGLIVLVLTYGVIHIGTLV